MESVLAFGIDKILDASASSDLFVGPVQSLLRTCALPFVKRTSTDEVKMLRAISSFVGVVGRVFRAGVPESLQIEAAEMLASFASVQGKRPVFLELGMGELPTIPDSQRQFHTNQAVIARSIVLGPLVSALGEQIEDSSPELKLALMKTLLQASYTRESCQQMLDAGVLAPLFKALDADIRAENASIGIELLWNLLENIPEARNLETRETERRFLARPLPLSMVAHVTVQEAPSTRRAGAEALTKLMGSFLQAGYRKQDKELRNETLIAIMLLAEVEANRGAFVEAGLVDLVLDIAVMPEITPDYTTLQGTASKRVKSFVLTKDGSDLEAKQLVWHIIGYLCTVAGALEAAVAGGFCAVLLMYLDGRHFQKQALARWNSAQMQDLQMQSLNILNEFVPLAPEAFIGEGGLEVLVAFLLSEVIPNDAVKTSLLQNMFMLCSLPGMQDKFAENGAVEVAIEMLQASTSATIRQDVVLWLAALCDGHRENQTVFRRRKGINVIVDKIAGLKHEDPTLPSPEAIAVLTAVWNCITPNKKSLARFLALDGLDAMLDLLDYGNHFLHGIILSLTADICENAVAHGLFHEWRSSRDQVSAAQILIRLWRKEEDARKVCEGGVIVNLTRPLAGNGSCKEGISMMESMYTLYDAKRKGAMEKMKGLASGEGLLSKIFAIFKLLGFDNFGYLSNRDAATLCFIKEFIRFKQGEVWQDIQERFERQGIAPTEIDQQRIESGVELVKSVADAVAERQAALIEVEAKELADVEQAFYSNMVAQKVQEREAKAYKKDRSSLTMKERLEAKIKKEEMLRNSFKHAQRASGGMTSSGEAADQSSSGSLPSGEVPAARDDEGAPGPAEEGEDADASGGPEEQGEPR